MRRRGGKSGLIRGLLATGSVVLALLPTAAGAQDQTSVLEFQVPGPISGCDPVGANVSPASAQVLSLVLPRVTISASNGTSHQADSVIAQAEVVNLKPLTVDYQVRKGARWSDGTRVGIADFRSSARRGSLGSSVSAPQYRLIRSIREGSSRHQIVVTFKKPTSAWQALFSPLMAASTSTAALSGCSSPSASADVSAGPYVIATSSPEQVVLVRNPRWRGRPPELQWITVVTTAPQGSSTIVKASIPTVSERSWMTTQGLTEITSSASVSSFVDHSDRLLSLNFSTQDGPTQPILVRQAIAHFIDRRAIVDKTVVGLDPTAAVAGSNLLSQGQPGYSGPSARPPSTGLPSTTTTTLPGSKPTGPQLATQQMRRAGWRLERGRWVDRSGSAPTLRLAFAEDDQWACSAARLVKSQLVDNHLKVRLIATGGSAEAAAAIRSHEAEMAIFARPTDPFIAHSAAWFSPPPQGPVSPLWTGYRDRVVDGLVRRASEIMNPVNAMDLYQDAGRRMWVMMPALPLYTEPFVTAWSSELAGVSVNPYSPGTLATASTWTVADPAP